VATVRPCRTHPRLWLLQRFDGLWIQELDYVDGMIISDVRNNSAWNHRYTILTRGPENLRIGGGSADEKRRLTEELRYTLSKLSLAPNNESAWNYLRGCVADRPTDRLCLRGGRLRVRAFHGVPIRAAPAW